MLRVPELFDTTRVVVNSKVVFNIVVTIITVILVMQTCYLIR